VCVSALIPHTCGVRAVLCILAKGDLVLAERKHSEYRDLDYTLMGTREDKLIDEIIKAYNDMDLAHFTDVLVDYDSVCVGAGYPEASRPSALHVLRRVACRADLEAGPVEDVNTCEGAQRHRHCRQGSSGPHVMA
jgi:hypothetical protein